uniref:Cytochrome P450 n=1 Tax=Megaselia scalaris TaxID=36166 RepID=T1GD42_MEGSC
SLISDSLNLSTKTEIFNISLKIQICLKEKIPKGTDIFMNTEEIMKESKNYPEPLRFIPERWLRENNEIKSKCPHARKSEHPFVYMPFGFGPRMCIGKRIVDLELEIGLTKILRHYKIEYNYPPEEVFTSYLINTPKAPLKFKFTDL